MDNKIKEFKKLRVRRRTLLAELKFLVWCRDAKLFPKSMAVKVVTCSNKVRRAAMLANLRVLRAIIKEKRTLIEAKEFALYLLHMELANKLDPVHWLVLDKQTFVEANLQASKKESKLMERRWDLVHKNNEEDANRGQWKVRFATKYKSLSCTYQGDELKRLRPMAGTPPLEVLNVIKGMGIFKITQRKVSPPSFRCPPKLGLPLVNLSSVQLTPSQQDLLCKGPKYALGPSNQSGSLLVSCVEKALNSVPEPKRSLVRSEIVKKCQDSTFKRSNEWKVFQEIKKNDVVFLKADKGETVVLMDKVDFELKVEEQLNSGTYDQLRKDPTCALVRKINKLMKNLTDPNLTNCGVPNPVAPRLFAQVKLHKDSRPLRLIVSGRNSPLNRLEKGIAQLIGKYAKIGSSGIKNSGQLVELLEQSTPPGQGETLISLDIIQLFPSLPRQETIEAVVRALEDDGATRDLRDDIVTALKFVFDNSYFTFGGKFFRQTKGSPIGSSLSPVLAEIFLTALERRAKDTLPFWPRLFVRYVDDHLVLINDDMKDIFVKAINSLHEEIKYTVEEPVDSCIAFLDVNINYKQLCYKTSVFRKPTNSGILVNNNSWHHQSHKTGMWRTLVHRAFSICNNEEALEVEFANLREMASLNGYHHGVVDKAVKRHYSMLKRKECTALVTNRVIQQKETVVLPYCGKISRDIGSSLKKATGKRIVYRPLNKIGERIFNTKDPLKKEEASGVYKVECNCGALYVGQTKRRFGIRLNEHKAALRNFEPKNSAIARHFWKQGCDQGIRWDDSSVILQVRDNYLLKYCEAMEICLEQARSPLLLMNDQEHVEHLKIWTQVNCGWLKPKSLKSPTGHDLKAVLNKSPPGHSQERNNEVNGKTSIARNTQSLLQVRSLTLLQSKVRVEQEGKTA